MLWATKDYISSRAELSQIAPKKTNTSDRKTCHRFCFVSAVSVDGVQKNKNKKRLAFPSFAQKIDRCLYSHKQPSRLGGQRHTGCCHWYGAVLVIIPRQIKGIHRWYVLRFIQEWRRTRRREGREKRKREREGGREREDCTLTATLQSARDAQRECNSSLLWDEGRAAVSPSTRRRESLHLSCPRFDQRPVERTIRLTSQHCGQWELGAKQLITRIANKHPRECSAAVLLTHHARSTSASCVCFLRK